MLGAAISSTYFQDVGSSLYGILSNNADCSESPGSSQNVFTHYDFTNPTTMFTNQNGTGVISSDAYIRHAINIADSAKYGYTPCIYTSPTSMPRGKFMISIADTDAGSPQYKTNVHNGLSAAYFNGSSNGLYNRAFTMAEGATSVGGGFYILGGANVPKYVNHWIVLKSASTSASAKEVLYKMTGPGAGSVACSGTMDYCAMQYASSDDDFEWEVHDEGVGTTTSQSGLNKSTSVEIITITQSYDGSDNDNGKIYKNADDSTGGSGLTYQSASSISSNSFGGSDPGKCIYSSIGCAASESSWDPSSFTSHWSGHLFEIISINAPQTGLVAQVDAYLKNKYAI